MGAITHIVWEVLNLDLKLMHQHGICLYVVTLELSLDDARMNEIKKKKCKREE